VSPAANAAVYAVAREAASDTPIKTQVEQHIIVSGTPSREALMAELRKRYEEASGRRGFRYHPTPTNVTSVRFICCPPTVRPALTVASGD
jgi:hypothetical protein